MKLALGILAATAVLWALPAGAQESHHFNAKALAAKYSLPVFELRKKVVNDEIIETSDDFIHEQSGIYALRTDLKKAIGFYTKKLGAPVEKTTDLGAKKYVFKAADPPGSLTRHAVTVSYDKLAKQVQITLWKRTYETAADADN